MIRQIFRQGGAAALCALALAAPAHSQDRPIRPGVKAPSFMTHTIGGDSLTLHSLRGKVALVDFWATWCPTCLEAMPKMEALHHQFFGQGLRVVGVSLDDASTISRVKPLLKHAHITYAIAVDPARNAKMAGRYDVVNPPSFVLIDKKGVVRWSQTGYGANDEALLGRMIKKLLAEKA